MFSDGAILRGSNTGANKRQPTSSKGTNQDASDQHKKRAPATIPFAVGCRFHKMLRYVVIHNQHTELPSSECGTRRKVPTCWVIPGPYSKERPKGEKWKTYAHIHCALEFLLHGLRFLGMQTMWMGERKVPDGASMVGKWMTN